MTTLADRIRTERKTNKLTQEKLGEIVGVGKSSVSQWESGLTKQLVGENLLKTAKALKVNPDWLSTGKGDKHGGIRDHVAPTLTEHQQIRPKLAEQEKSIIQSNASYFGTFEEWDSNTPLNDDEVDLPFFREVEMAAGNGRHQVQENHGCKLRFSKSTLKRHGVAVDSAYCVTISGDSMEPMMPDGCVIGIDTSNTTIKDRDIYAIDHNGFLRVKQLFSMPDGRIRLHSLNEDWIDEFVGGDDLDTFKVLGRVFWGSWLR